MAAVVPSQLHEVLVMLFRKLPELAPTLLRESLGVELPEYTEARIDSAELSDVTPTEYRADLVVLLLHGKPVLGIVVEAQLAKDERKLFSWPVYTTSLRARLQCACLLLVITPTSSVADWAAAPIVTGPGSLLTPFVIGPAGVPVVTDPERAREAPELGVLSALAHGKADVHTAVQIAHSVSAGTAHLDEDTRALYHDLIHAALSEAARKAFEMLPENYQFQSPIYKRGKLEGKALGEAQAVITFLETRGLAVSDEQRARISSCTDLDTLETWVRRAVTVTSVDALFE